MMISNFYLPESAVFIIAIGTVSFFEKMFKHI